MNKPGDNKDIECMISTVSALSPPDNSGLKINKNNATVTLSGDNVQPGMSDIDTKSGPVMESQIVISEVSAEVMEATPKSSG